MGRQGEESKGSDGFRSVVGTGAGQKLKEAAAVDFPIIYCIDLFSSTLNKHLKPRKYD